MCGTTKCACMKENHHCTNCGTKCKNIALGTPRILKENSVDTSLQVVTPDEVGEDV